MWCSLFHLQQKQLNWVLCEYEIFYFCHWTRHQIIIIPSKGRRIFRHNDDDKGNYVHRLWYLRTLAAGLRKASLISTNSDMRKREKAGPKKCISQTFLRKGTRGSHRCQQSEGKDENDAIWIQRNLFLGEISILSRSVLSDKGKYVPLLNLFLFSCSQKLILW